MEERVVLGASVLAGMFACTGPTEVRPRPADPRDTEPTIDLPTPPEGDPFLQFAGDRPSHVLMVSMDTTRRDHIGNYAPDGTLYTPFLAEIADTGVHLDDHQQCSNWTFGSTSCTLAGRYATEAGYVPKLVYDPDQALPDGQRSLAVRLGEAGYYSVLISGNSWMAPARNNAQGYSATPAVRGGSTSDHFWQGIEEIEAHQATSPTPWLLHVHLMDPHPPYVPPEGYRDEQEALPPAPEEWNLDQQQGQYDVNAQWPTMTEDERDLLESHLRARYHGELRYMDDQIRNMWDVLEERGLLDDTLVVFWTDHGEQFWEHGSQAHAYFLGAEENDAVLFFWAKNLVSRPWTKPTHSVDLVPTILQAIGSPAPTDDPELSGYVLGTAPSTRPRFAESVARLGVLQSVTLDGWKLTFNFAGIVKLYDRNTDRYELVDLYAPDHERVPELWDLLIPRIERMHELEPTRPLTWPTELPHP